MHRRLFLALACALLIVRLPSLAQPMGPDQGLYAYVGERILHGDLAYRDAWDQKPPGIHYVYAALRAVWSGDAVVPAADLAAAAAVAALLWRIGSGLGGPVAGGLSSLFFLLLSDPSLTRLGGVRVRAQAETFISLAVAGAVAVILDRAADRAKGAERAAPERPGRALRLAAAGLLLGAAFALKYNAGLYVLVLLFALAVTTGLAAIDVVWIGAGALVIPLALLAVFWRGHALGDLYQATIAYNLQYLGETYAGPLAMVVYLLTFPIRHARVDPLWFVGGAGCAVLVWAGMRQRRLWIPIVWFGVACASIAVNGSRDLPQYFVQAAPALGLAAGVAARVRADADARAGTLGRRAAVGVRDLARQRLLEARVVPAPRSVVSVRTSRSARLPGAIRRRTGCGQVLGACQSRDRRVPGREHPAR